MTVEPPKLPKFDSRITLGNLITICTGALVLMAAGVALQADIRALAQRVDKGELRDDRTADTLDGMKGSIIRIETEQKAVRAEAERIARQLDRIEQLIRREQMPARVP